MKRLILLITLLLAGGAWGADDSCGCITQFDATGSGLTSDNLVWMYAKTTGATGGTLDSLIFWARSIGPDPADTLYGCVYDTTAGGAVGALVAVSTDSAIVPEAGSWVRCAVHFAAGTINANTRYFFGVDLVGLGGSAVRVSVCADGVPGEARRERYTDVWPLDDPSPDGTADTTNYAPTVLIYYSSASSGATKKLGAVKLGAGKL